MASPRIRNLLLHTQKLMQCIQKSFEHCEREPFMHLCLTTMVNIFIRMYVMFNNKTSDENWVRLDT